MLDTFFNRVSIVVAVMVISVAKDCSKLTPTVANTVPIMLEAKFCVKAIPLFPLTLIEFIA